MERRERQRVAGERRVEPEAADAGHGALGIVVAEGRDAVEHRYPVGEKRQRAAAVREDEANVRPAPEDSLEDQVRRHPRRLERIVDEHARNVPAAGLGARRIAGVDEHDGAPAVELGIEGLEIRMADIAVVDAGQQGDPVESELVVNAGGLRERRIDVRKGQEAEPAEPSGMPLGEPGEKIVALPRQVPGLGDVAEPYPRRGEGEDRRVDPVGLHQRKAFLRGPLRKPPICRTRDAGRALGRDVEIGKDVMMHVDAARTVHACASISVAGPADCSRNARPVARPRSACVPEFGQERPGSTLARMRRGA